MHNKYSRFVPVLLIATAPLFVSACATVTRGLHETLVIETDPPGAAVEVDNQRLITPAKVTLSKKFAGPVVISKQGYETATVHVKPEFVSAGGVGMAGNVILGGILGIGIDAASGASNSLRPNPIKVSLVRVGEQPSVAEPVATAPDSPPAAMASASEAVPSAPAPAADPTPTATGASPSGESPAAAASSPPPAS